LRLDISEDRRQVYSGAKVHLICSPIEDSASRQVEANLFGTPSWHQMGSPEAVLEGVTDFGFVLAISKPTQKPFVRFSSRMARSTPLRSLHRIRPRVSWDRGEGPILATMIELPRRRESGR